MSFPISAAPIRRQAMFALICTLGCCIPLSADQPLDSECGPQRKPAISELEIHPVTVAEGIRRCSFGNDAGKFSQTGVFKAAAAANIDLTQPPHPVVVHAFHQRRFFYVFYNLVTVPKGRAQYLLQRIRKTILNYSTDDTVANEQVFYLVEAFKTLDDRGKKPDEHYGGFSLGRYAKRVIVKEFEVGFGSVEGIAESKTWPFLPTRLYHSIHGYQAEDATYQKVKFSDSIRWTMRLEFDAYGSYSLTVPELDIRISHELPRVLDAEHEKGHIVLTEGSGALGVRLNATNMSALRQQLGEPLSQRRIQSAVNYEYANGLTFHIPNNQTVKSIQAAGNFRGVTSRGIGLGDTRLEVLGAYGKPVGDPKRVLMYPGVLFWMGSEDEVERIVLRTP